jgi:hypothetical protein
VSLFIVQASYDCLGSAAILSFLASFFLVRYRIKEAKKEELMAAGVDVTSSPPNHRGPHRDHSRGRFIYSSNPRLEHVGLFSSSTEPPTALLSRCHLLCVFLAAVGFVLALAGMVSYAWAAQPFSVAVFASVAMGLCLVSGLLVFTS